MLLLYLLQPSPNRVIYHILSFVEFVLVFRGFEYHSLFLKVIWIDVSLWSSMACLLPADVQKLLILKWVTFGCMFYSVAAT